MKKSIKFIYIFFIIGLESLGNMSAVTAVLEDNLMKKNKLVTQEDIIDAVSMSRLGPGAVTANAVAFLGNKIAGFWGGFFATFFYTLGPLIIIISISCCIENLLQYQFIASALKGSLVCIGVMLIKSTISMGKVVLINKFTIYIFIMSLILSIFLNISSIYIILIALILRNNKNCDKKFIAAILMGN
ncbi:MAG: chromate transporter [Clostridia bacterium]|nr:chromate transporter [Clostridia bacterium]